MRRMGLAGPLLLCVALLAAAPAHLRAANSYPDLGYYNLLDTNQKEMLVDKDGKFWEDFGVCSKQEYRSIWCAKQSGDEFGFLVGTDTDPSAWNFQLFLSWFTKFKASGSFVNASGTTVTVDTAQRPDGEDATSTTSQLDRRHQLIFSPMLSWFTPMLSGELRAFVRGIVRPMLASDATMRDQILACQICASTQYDTEVVRNMVKPLLNSPQPLVKAEAQRTLDSLWPAPVPPDPWDAR